MAEQITESSLKAALIERVSAVYVEVTDISGGCGQSFTALIVSSSFAGLNSLKRHRLVNAALKAEIASIHAWTAKCQTPEEYQRDTGVAPPMAGTLDGRVEGTTA
ncbi:hypothetical protein TD95_000268 [Thielaviopsis punctulata]|uniref:BolA protein n=1 Tax=Thielaviopsis punctulata TaxID=72032 RepID=A0A0F4ZFE7_9PEZI|nr:hypothetical protein TD95_000268 [Thielaviopsis punctulata]